MLPGARIGKSIIAVFISLILSRYVLHISGFYMTIAVILAMKRDSDAAKTYGKNRILGTIVGGFVGFVAISILHAYKIDEYSILMLLVNGLCLFLILWFSKLAKFGDTGASMGCVVYCSITLIRFNVAIPPYVLMRVFETSMGVVISILVNFIDFKKLSTSIQSHIHQNRSNK